MGEGRGERGEASEESLQGVGLKADKGFRLKAVDF